MNRDGNPPNKQIFFSKSPKWTNKLKLNWSVICSSNSLSFSCLQALVHWLSFTHVCRSFLAILLIRCRRSQKLKTDWFTDMQIKQLQMTGAAWSKRRRFQWSRTGYGPSVWSESAFRERTNQWLAFFYLFCFFYWLTDTSIRCKWMTVGTAWLEKTNCR